MAAMDVLLARSQQGNREVTVTIADQPALRQSQRTALQTSGGSQPSGSRLTVAAAEGQRAHASSHGPHVGSSAGHVKDAETATDKGDGKKKRHRHTRTWAGPGEKRSARDKQQDNIAPNAPASPYLSEEERNVFLRSPQLLNEPSFEPRVIKGASPYVPKTKKSGRQSEEDAAAAASEGNAKRKSARNSSEDDDEILKYAGTEATVEEEEREEKEKEKRRAESKVYQGIHRRYNSMQTLHLASVLHSPDVQEILHCFSRAVYGNIKLSETVQQQVFLDVYSEMIHPLNEGSRRKMPTVEEIEHFVTRIYTGIALAPENCVMALAYIERLVALTNVTLHPTNWRRIVLAALLLASKVWEDLAVHNRDMLRFIHFPFLLGLFPLLSFLRLI